MWDLTIHLPYIVFFSPSPPLANIVYLGVFPFGFRLKIFNTRLLRKCFHTLIKKCFVPLFNRCVISQSTSLLGSTFSLTLVPLSNWYGISQSTPQASVLAGILPSVHPLWGLASSLTHYPVSNSDIICNSPCPPLASIVLFRLSFSSCRYCHLLTLLSFSQR